MQTFPDGRLQERKQSNREQSMAMVLITGISGYVGRAVGPLALSAGYLVTGTYHRQVPQTVDLPGSSLVRASVEQLPSLIATLRPDVVLHTAAAWRAEAEAQHVIVEGTRGIAEAALLVGARLIHISTDLVFDGVRSPYREDSRPSPVNFYGEAKAAAERIVLDLSPGAVIVRTSLVTRFDPPDPRTAPILLALRRESPPVTLFTDEYRCPVRTEDLAAALVELIGRVAAFDDPFSGFLHIAGPERLSRYELGLRIARFYGLPPAPGIIPGLAANSAQVRPRDCTLEISLARQLLQTPLRPLPSPQEFGDLST